MRTGGSLEGKNIIQLKKDAACLKNIGCWWPTLPKQGFWSEHRSLSL
jgi:hypothetical protein